MRAGLAVGCDGADLEAGQAAVYDVLAPGALPVALRVELLNSVIERVCDVDIARCIGRDSSRKEQLAAEAANGAGLAVGGDRAYLEAGAAAVHDVLAPGPLPFPLCVVLLDPLLARVDDVDVPHAIERNAAGVNHLSPEAAIPSVLAVGCDGADLEAGIAAVYDVLAPRSFHASGRGERRGRDRQK